MKKLLTVLFISTVMVFAGCDKEGSEGPAGPQGPQGNANVKTAILEVKTNEWTFLNNQYQVDITTNLLTQDIIDNGSAHLYYEINTGEWLALPVSTMLFYVSVNNLHINSGQSFNETQSFKLVTIAGQLQAKVDFNNYEEVKARFNLAD